MFQVFRGCGLLGRDSRSRAIAVALKVRKYRESGGEQDRRNDDSELSPPQCVEQ